MDNQETITLCPRGVLRQLAQAMNGERMDFLSPEKVEHRPACSEAFCERLRRMAEEASPSDG
jgi:hypothetical protein